MDLPSNSRDVVVSLLRREKLVQGSVFLVAFSGDGSDRQFFRIKRQEGPNLLVVLPSSTFAQAQPEARASYLIGKHLCAQGVPVPEIFCFDEETGAVVFEDLGNLLLHDVLRQDANHPQDMMAWYQRAIEALVLLQLRGCQGFKPAFCWDTVRYDRHLMLRRESHYFWEAFCRDYLDIQEESLELLEEFEQLASRAAEEPAHFLLHRDFQSRNLMIHQGEIKIIDYQGARFGPLGYDLASLLLDPYAGLDLEQQETLIDYYLTVLGGEISVDRKVFMEGYYFLRLQRNLQIIGAYSFLSLRKRKPFFRQFLKPAVEALHLHLRQPEGRAFPRLRQLVENCLASPVRKTAKKNSGKY